LSAAAGSLEAIGGGGGGTEDLDLSIEWVAITESVACFSRPSGFVSCEAGAALIRESADELRGRECDFREVEDVDGGREELVRMLCRGNEA